jgi:hypothetical protein
MLGTVVCSQMFLSTFFLRSLGILISFNADGPAVKLGDAMLGIMCSKGKNCECAKLQSVFDASLNTIGAANASTSLEALRTSRSLEIQAIKRLVKSDRRICKINQVYRRSLIEISQCPGIGKTTLLGLIARDFSDILAEASGNGSANASNKEVIASLVTFNGRYMGEVISSVPMEAALCSRVLYGALSCHSAFPGKHCPNLLQFDHVANEVVMVHRKRKISVLSTCQVLWHWFGRKPIFIGIDEALKCSDGTERIGKRLQALLTASGAFLDKTTLDLPAYVVLSARSPDWFLRATIASNRVVENVLVYPIDRKAGVLMLDSIIKSSVISDIMVDRDVLAQVEALTVGHPRAIERAGYYILDKLEDDSKILSSRNAARGLFIPLVKNLVEGTSNALASRPPPFVLEHLISNPPAVFERGVTLHMGRHAALVDDLVFSGQVLVTSGSRPTLTVAGWWLFNELTWIDTKLDDSRECPSASLLRAAYKATKDPFDDVPSSLYEAFSIFFFTEAMRRGGATLKDVIPHLYRADPSFDLTRDAISIETMTIETMTVPAHGLDFYGMALLVSDRVNILRTEKSKGVILIMPRNVPALDAIIIAGGKVIGCQIRSSVEESKLIGEIDNLRKCIEGWKEKGCDILGADGLLLFSVGVDSKPAGLQLRDNESFSSTQQLRQHFMDVFFRCGLTSGEASRL